MLFEFVVWLFITLILFLIVFIFAKILSELNQLHRRQRIDESIKFIKEKVNLLEELLESLRSKRKR